MKCPKIKGPNEIYLLLGAVFLGVLLQTIFFFHLKFEILSNNSKIDLYFSTKPTFDTNLYYSYNNSFAPSQRVNGEMLDDNTVRFLLPQRDSIITNLRLDFENASKSSKIFIDSLKISFGSSNKVLSQDEIFEHIFLNSESINLNVKDRIIGFNKNVNPFDPYLIFDPLLHIIMDDHPLKRAALFFPFVIVLVILILRQRLLGLKISTTDFLFLAFIISIPLKIAWTTFTAILIGIWSLYRITGGFNFNFKNPHALFLLSLFLALCVLGRPTEINVIDHQVALLIFYLIICSTIFQGNRFITYYVYVFLFLNALLITSALGFLISFENIFGLEISEYFRSIKIYSGNIRDWLYYDHAAFLSFFAMMALPLMDEMDGFNRKSEIFWLYNILLVLTIILMGVRISFFIYFVILLNLFLKRDHKWGIVFNTILFVFTAIFLFVKIDTLDQNRYELWRVSWEAIKERPFFGYGLGSSDSILHDAKMMKRTGIKISEILNHSHNQFLTFWLELGLAGLLSMFTFLVVYLKRTGQYKSKPMVLFIFGLGYIFLTESVLQTSKPFFVLCFLFAMITTKNDFKSRNQQQSNEL